MTEMAQIESTIPSKKVRRMFGFDLDWWNTAMVVSLGFGAIAALAVLVSTAVVIKLQKETEVELKLALEREIAARQPRTITPEQHRTLVRLLTPTSNKGRVVVKPNFVDMEATPFANQITQALTEAGFTGVGDAPLDIVLIGDAGIVIAVRDRDKPPPHAMPIIAAFAAAGIAAKPVTAPFVPDADTVVIAVGRKP